MGINSVVSRDDCGDPDYIEPLPSLLQMDKELRESGRLKRQPSYDASGPKVRDIEFTPKKPEAESDSFGSQKPYTP